MVSSGAILRAAAALASRAAFDQNGACASDVPVLS
jgi:hypothetical protein